MGHQTVTLLVLVTLVSQVYMAPQFITFNDGKLGVNFGGYHAGVGIGGLLNGSGTGGGLYAEAGTPNGQSARAGLGGSVGEKGGASGGLFAGATAGGNVKASAGLSGGVNAQKSVGGGFASAQAGDRFASSGLAGESSIYGSAGATHTLEVKPNVQTAVNIDSANEVKPVEFLPLNNAGSKIKANVNIQGDIQPPVVVKEVSRMWKPDNYYYDKPIYPTFNFQDIINSVFEVYPRPGYGHRSWMPQRKYNHRAFKVYVEPQPIVVEKHIIHSHYKPRRHHFHKTAFIGGYLGSSGDVIPSTVHEIKPAVHKRIDISAAANANAGAAVATDAHSGVGHTYTKQISYHSNPTFFQDIFNIPISTLKAVGSFLGNAAGNTNVSVQKSASVQAGAYL